ncbi:hypothetical protein Bxe_B1959 [Paraburkholderia xenovorans LB400]|uniref:Uncharacterized protein n=1 Tax=Paraburkholderia xenovorans (strain LB400) TaxID=266265 RepID=Q13PG6_PARXL|nr:hypothetical protein Bxe_B1959 [Paraburkholderia xenovorans LB400]
MAKSMPYCGRTLANSRARPELYCQERERMGKYAAYGGGFCSVTQHPDVARDSSVYLRSKWLACNSANLIYVKLILVLSDWRSLLINSCTIHCVQ